MLQGYEQHFLTFMRTSYRNSHRLADYLEARQADGSILLITSTGDAYPHKNIGDKGGRKIDEFPMAKPRILISSAGEHIHVDGFDKDQRKLIPDWEEHLKLEISESLLADLRRFLTRYPGLSLIDAAEDEKSPFITFVEICNEQEKYAFQSDLEKDLRSSFGGAFKISDWFGEKYRFDVRPSCITKHSALQFIINRFDLSHVPVIVAGDSLNDFEILAHRHPKFRAVLVGNATSGLIEKLGNRFYDHEVYMAPPDCVGAAGVLMGLKAFGLDAPEPEFHQLAPGSLYLGRAVCDAVTPARYRGRKNLQSGLSP